MHCLISTYASISSAKMKHFFFFEWLQLQVLFLGFLVKIKASRSKAHLPTAPHSEFMEINYL